MENNVSTQRQGERSQVGQTKQWPDKLSPDIHKRLMHYCTNCRTAHKPFIALFSMMYVKLGNIGSTGPAHTGYTCTQTVYDTHITQITQWIKRLKNSATFLELNKGAIRLFITSITDYTQTYFSTATNLLLISPALP